MRWVLGALLVVMLPWAAVSRAHACKCAPPPPVSDALHAAFAVFEGRVLAINPVPADSGQAPITYAVRLGVVRSWKGAETEVVSVLTPIDGPACGYPFVQDESYLVYASEQDGKLRVDSCGRTRAAADASDDITVLGIGVVPVSPRKPDAGQAHAQTDAAKQTLPPGSGGCASCTVSGRRETPAPWLTTTLAGLFALRSVRRRRARPGNAG